MLQVTSQRPLSAMEPALLQAAQRRGLNVLSVLHVGQLLQQAGASPARDAVIFTVCRADLSSALLAADLRFANFIPCRIAALEQEGSVTLEALTPGEICALLGREDLAGLAAPLEAFLREILEEAARPLPATQVRGAAREIGLGATEGMVNARASIPQRIDCKGTKVEDLAGTGQHDAQGG
ncbi:MAG TPA: DUF302 domain-containing protein [Bryobacteraceae bacterium]|nr:DUF302 domain-containing protein [Bryobacteraceae bacterium]